ncbi:hypothetical protein BD414DRAFT_562160, partial [Trametes punicea]
MLLVCRHWFVVGATTPSPWRFLFARTKLNYIRRTALAPSKGTMLTLAVADLYFVSDTLTLVGPHAHRLRHLWLYRVAHDDAPQLAAFMEIRCLRSRCS